MKTIWKFEIDFSNKKVMMPVGCKILSTQIQSDIICIWAEVDTGEIQEEVIFEVFGTGHELPQNMGISREYVGTVQIGPTVWHIYKYTGV